MEDLPEVTVKTCNCGKSPADFCAAVADACGECGVVLVSEAGAPMLAKLMKIEPSDRPGSSPMVVTDWGAFDPETGALKLA